MDDQTRYVNRLYAEYNAQFFGGALPRFRVTLSKSLLLSGERWNARHLIRLKRGQDPERLGRTLLHEMCHIGTRGHGERFQEKLTRLIAQGETWAMEDLDACRHRATSRQRWANVRTLLFVCAAARTREPFQTVVSNIARAEFAESGRWLRQRRLRYARERR